MSWLKWSGSRWIPSLSAGTKDALCLSLKKGQPLLPLEQSYCFSSARSTCCHISFKGTFSDSWKLGKCSDEMLLFIMKASLRSLYFRACARSLFLFCNSISNTSFSKQQLTLISMWNWLAPGSLTSERLSYAVPCSLTWVEGEGGVCFFFGGVRGVGVQCVWDGGNHHKTLESGRSWGSAAGSSAVVSQKWSSLDGIMGN